jgi:hypothetical protein
MQNTFDYRIAGEARILAASSASRGFGGLMIGYEDLIWNGNELRLGRPGKAPNIV